MQALADVTGLPVACTEVPAGAALGSAWLARLAAGLEAPTAMADGRRWARVGRELEPRPAWRAATEERYQRYAAMWPVTGAGG
jgi:xylulokinase